MHHVPSERAFARDPASGALASIAAEETAGAFDSPPGALERQRCGSPFHGAPGARRTSRSGTGSRVETRAGAGLSTLPFGR